MSIPVVSELALIGGAKLTGVPTPTAGTDAASKSYVDARVMTLSVDVNMGSVLTTSVTQAFSWPGLTTSHGVVACFSGQISAVEAADEMEMDAHTVGAVATAADTVTVVVYSASPTIGQRRVRLIASL